MEIPEGWPTEEMVAAARGIPQIGHSSYYWRQVILNVLAAAPTPPEQEQDDEPIYLVFSNDTYYDGSWEFVNKDEFDKANEDDRYKLYTRPDNSELRKAAGELLKICDGQGRHEMFHKTLENLRDALERT